MIILVTFLCIDICDAVGEDLVRESVSALVSYRKPKEYVLYFKDLAMPSMGPVCI